MIHAEDKTLRLMAFSISITAIATASIGLRLIVWMQESENRMWALDERTKALETKISLVGSSQEQKPASR